MRTTFGLGFLKNVFLLLLAAAIGVDAQTPSLVADLIIRNASVYTADAQHPWAQAIAIKSERILFVGGDDEISRYSGPATKTLDAGGHLVLPGFIDSHLHVRLGGDPDVLNITDANSLQEIQQQVRDFSNRRPDLRWIEAEGWNYSAFPNGTLPTAKDLEGLTDGRPAFLVAYDYHTVWMNQPAMREFKLARGATHVNFAEKVETDSASGDPTGIITGFGSTGLSGEAEQQLRQLLPSHSPERVLAKIRANIATAVTYGITTVVDPQSFLEDLPIYTALRQQGQLPTRLQVALFHRRGDPDSLLEQFDRARAKFNDDQIRVSAVKLYIDDVIEPHTAAMLAPYADRPGEVGQLDYPPEEFKILVAKLDRMKFQIFIHSIGDRGIRTALDALEFAQQVNGVRDSRHELIHIECLNPQDLPRFRKLGVVACMQPRHLAPDITGQWAKAVGPERSRYAWALRSLRDSGAVLAFASDWNVASMDPLVGIYTALTRKGLDGQPDEGWIPQQRIDLETAIRGYTINGAYANFVEQNRGSITEGKYADIVMLSDNLFEIPAAKIKDAHVLLTLVAGRAVYRAPQ
jgi:predicted amidohydrolase YtcJ